MLESAAACLHCNAFILICLANAPTVLLATVCILGLGQRNSGFKQIARQCASAQAHIHRLELPRFPDQSRPNVGLKYPEDGS